MSTKKPIAHFHATRVTYLPCIAPTPCGYRRSGRFERLHISATPSEKVGSTNSSSQRGSCWSLLPRLTGCVPSRVMTCLSHLGNQWGAGFRCYIAESLIALRSEDIKTRLLSAFAFSSTVASIPHLYPIMAAVDSHARA